MISEIVGFLKQDFCEMTNERFAYGSSSITDGHSKINIKVKDATKDFSNLKKGLPVRIYGTIDVDGEFSSFPFF